MSPNIYRFELRMKRRSAVIWSLAAVGVTLLYMVFFPTFANQAALLRELMTRFPREFLEAFGISRVDMSAVLGFYSFLFLFVQLLMAVQASLYGFGLVSVEEAEMTADFLLTRPVTRAQALTSKLLAAATALLLTDLALWLATPLILHAFRHGQTIDVRTLGLMLASLPPFQAFFLFVGVAVSLLAPRVRNATSYALGLAFGMYLLAAFSGMAGDVKLEWITPFKQFDAQSIVLDRTWDLPLASLGLSIALIALVVSYWRYLHRDIPAAA
ncbi:MAG TPA: hypothetical protein EYP25_01775 [Anaerolineae bacterium]|nr:ABC transporter permease subunit [Caldilineae bacterium]HID33299.1 hypothetical protein [Anaerolineae bacterium]HIQ12172.1 hypothetical protein [Caldilineales bacterium]